MRRPTLRSTILAAALVAGAALTVPALIPHPALAEQAPPAASPKPYQVVAIQLPQPYKDVSFDAFRKQLAAVAKKKDKAALGRMIAQSFFWIPDDKDTADKSKPPIESFAKAVSLDGQYGWETVEDFAAVTTADPNPERAGVICAPGSPKFDQKAAEALEKATGTQPSDWSYPVRNGVEVSGAPAAPGPRGKEKAAKGRAAEKLGLHLVWLYPDPAAKDDLLRIVTPSGQVGHVAADSLRQVYSDQVCYVKEGAAWKIAGVLGTFGDSN